MYSEDKTQQILTIKKLNPKDLVISQLSWQLEAGQP